MSKVVGVCICPDTHRLKDKTTATLCSPICRTVCLHLHSGCYMRLLGSWLALHPVTMSCTHFVSLATSLSMNNIQTVHHAAFSFLWAGTVAHDWTITPATLLPGRAHLHSAQNGDYNMPCALTGFSLPSFSSTGPDAWNSLPRGIRCIVVPATFKRHLKAQLFSRAYNVSLDISDNWSSLMLNGLGFTFAVTCFYFASTHHQGWVSAGRKLFFARQVV